MNNRCEMIKNMLKEAGGPLSASKLAEKLGVSRQVIVGDVALLRASGTDIVSTPRGYIINPAEDEMLFGHIGIVACRHTVDRIREELYTIVDFGGTVIDVSIEHAVYGELSGRLDIASRYDADLFMQKIEKNDNSAPISSLTGGIHFHRIGCRNREIFEKINMILHEKNIAI